MALIIREIASFKNRACVVSIEYEDVTQRIIRIVTRSDRGVRITIESGDGKAKVERSISSGAKGTVLPASKPITLNLKGQSLGYQLEIGYPS